MPQLAHDEASSIHGNLRSPRGLETPAATTVALAFESSATIDDLAYLLASDRLSTLEKVALLEQWRYDTLLLGVAAGEGFGTGCDDGSLLQQINKALFLLARHRRAH